MTRKKNVLPSYLLHKASGQARVRIDGKEYLLGDFGSEVSRIRYGQLIAQSANGVPCDPVAKSYRGKVPRNDSGPSVAEVCLIFLQHAQTHYVKDGRQTTEIDCFRSAIKPLVQLYGSLPASDLGPLAVKAIRKEMVENGWSRKYVNKSVGRIRKVFRHAVENELIEPAVLQRLQAISPLLVGRTEAPDYAPRKPVPQENIDAVKNVVSERTSDLIDLQLLTGARSGELLGLTTGMIDRTSRDVWLAKIANHKTIHLGKDRTIVFGPKAQMILSKYFKADPTARLFQVSRTTYGHAVGDACTKLGLPRFTPHWLRHNAASRLRETFGLDVAQVALGHSSANVTQLYAHLDLKKTIEAAARCG